MIRYLDVWKGFDQPVLRGVTVSVGEGETFGIFGPSGAGKSVLLKSTIGLVTPDRGDVLVEGDSAFHGGRESLDRIRRKVGYVFQHAALFDSLTVFENVEMGIAEAELREIPRRDAARKIWEALEIVNLDPHGVLEKLPAELSGGMKKRVGIARAIVGRPRILLWDEPTTGLDPVNTAAVERLIVQLTDQLKVTSVVVTHDIEGGLDMCDRVAMLSGGTLRFVGTPNEFRASTDTVVHAFVDRDAALAALEEVPVL
jgi:phospholipid/cholesterol/gamma-HCH transport system ATP-binding protein